MNEFERGLYSRDEAEAVVDNLQSTLNEAVRLLREAEQQMQGGRTSENIREFIAKHDTTEEHAKVEKIGKLLDEARKKLRKSVDTEDVCVLVQRQA